jgi:DNA processing protein
MARPATRVPDLASLLTLLATPGLPDWRVLELLTAHGTPRAALDSLAQECGVRLAADARSASVQRRVERALHAVEAEGIAAVPFGTPGYPSGLVHNLGPAAPPLLFARGDLGVLQRPGIAVVGSRAASEYARDVAEEIGTAIARAGGCVISGLARGVDAATHAAALDAGGTTVAVLGCGVDVYYPQDNMRLQDRIAGDGLLVSEFLPGEGPRKYRFPHRNRIIAALSRAVVVVEAGRTSGALGTASHAMERGIATFAVPNAVDHPGMQGILGLYRDGVLPFTGTRDLLESTGLLPLGQEPAMEPLPADDGRGPVGTMPPFHERILGVLRRQPAHVDAIAAEAGMTASAALAALLELELDGLVRQVPGGRFGRATLRRRA